MVLNRDSIHLLGHKATTHSRTRHLSIMGRCSNSLLEADTGAVIVGHYITIPEAISEVVEAFRTTCQGMDMPHRMDRVNHINPVTALLNTYKALLDFIKAQRSPVLSMRSSNQRQQARVSLKQNLMPKTKMKTCSAPQKNCKLRTWKRTRRKCHHQRPRPAQQLLRGASVLLSRLR